MFPAKLANPLGEDIVFSLVGWAEVAFTLIPLAVIVFIIVIVIKLK